MKNPLIVNTVELKEACEAAKAAGVLALDTEFVWRATYLPRLGLIQMGAGRESDWAIDVMKGLDAAPLAALIADPSVVKILHDARQDLQHLYHYSGGYPKNVFDTQLAAAFAGFPAGIGLQKLLMEAVDVGLPKTETCSDWTRRPLTPSQVDYALDDVRYLPELREELLSRADALGTRAWLEEELAKFDDEFFYGDFDPEESWKRIRSPRIHLEGSDFAVLKALAATREEAAREWNLPRGWLAEDASLAFMAHTRSTAKFRHRLSSAQAAQVQRRYESAIREAAALPEDEWPLDPHPRYIDEVLSAADEAVKWLKERAAEIHVADGVIANRATVTAFVDNVEDGSNPLPSGWRWASSITAAENLTSA